METNVRELEKKLSRWRANLLSKAGRLVLIKIVLNSLSLYYLGLFKMPKAVAKKKKKKNNSLQSKFF